jgi:hypothetical protein
MFTVVLALKLVAEIGVFAFIGQFLLGLLAGDKRENNAFYKLLEVLTKPFTSITRAITPKVVIDRHIPLAAFVLLVSLWGVASWSKADMCFKAMAAGQDVPSTCLDLLPKR